MLLGCKRHQMMSVCRKWKAITPTDEGLKMTPRQLEDAFEKELIQEEKDKEAYYKETNAFWFSIVSTAAKTNLVD